MRQPAARGGIIGYQESGSMMNSNELLNVPVQNQSEVFANESMSADNSFASPMDAAH